MTGFGIVQVRMARKAFYVKDAASVPAGLGMNAKIDGKGGLTIKMGSSTVEAKTAWCFAKEALSTEPGFDAS